MLLYLLYHKDNDLTSLSNSVIYGDEEYTPASREYFNIDLVANTLDLNAGQAVDRIGLLLGCTFPCGKELENFALWG